jgi:hypothetical protein
MLYESGFTSDELVDILAGTSVLVIVIVLLVLKTST